jgi:sporulation protein YlmC with PRC-barrel domain
MPQLESKPSELKGIRITQQEDQVGQINPKRITATTIIGNKVKNNSGEELGEIEEIVFDLTSGTISYIVMSSGGLAGIGDKFFAVPLDALTLDTGDKFFTLDVDKKTVKKARGFDKNDWPTEAQWPIKQP